MSIRRAQDERIEGTPDGLNAITEIMDVPDAPTIGTATGSGTTASVPFTAAVTGGTPTSYTATSTPGSITATSATSPISVSGLTGGTSYTFKVKGTNSTGTGPDSSASNSITATLVNFVFNTSQTPQNYYNAGGSGFIASDGTIYAGGNQGSSSTPTGLLMSVSGQGVANWIKSYTTMTSTGNNVYLITGDPSGNVYGIGSTTTSYGLISKFTSAGAISYQKVTAINGYAKGGWYTGVTDSSGNLAVNGVASVDGGSSGSSYYSFPTAKYDSSGTQIWASLWGVGAGSSNGTDIAIDGSGNVFAAGKTFTGNYQSPIVKLKASDGTILAQNCSNDNYDGCMTYDTANNVLIKCYGKSNYFIITRWNSSNLSLISQVSNSLGTTNPYGVTVDSSGNIYVCCTSKSDGTNLEVSIWKYNSSLTLQWYRTLKNSNSTMSFSQLGNCISLDSTQANLVITGVLKNTAGTYAGTAIWKLPVDGSKTGTYSWAVDNSAYGSYTYAAGSGASGNNQSIGVAGSISCTRTAGSNTDQTLTNSAITNYSISSGVTGV